MSIENRAMAVVGRVCAVVIAFALGAIATQAQTLSNGGFEFGTPPTPTNWTVFNNAYMIGTNCPGDANNTCTNLTVHSGAYSLKTYGPFNGDYDASGAYQDFTGVTVGDTWKVSGYALNSSGDPLVGSNGWGMGQIQFRDFTNGIIQVNESAHFGTDTPLPVDQWTAFQAVGTVPVGTVTMRVQVLHVGIPGAGGSVWFDDVTLSKRAGVANIIGATSQSGIQLSWPTTVAANYQVQTTTNLLPSTFWSNFGSVIIGSSYSNQVFDAFGSSLQRFYRVHSP